MRDLASWAALTIGTYFYWNWIASDWSDWPKVAVGTALLLLCYGIGYWHGRR